MNSGMTPVRKSILALSAMMSCLRAASGEKVMFHDEITGREMWRISVGLFDFRSL